MKINKLNREKLPFEHLSPSSVVEFLVNEKSFFKRYVLYKWDEKTSPALIIGTAFHFAMEQYYNSIIAVGEGVENAKILTPEEVIIHGVNQMKKQFSYHEKRGIEKLLDEKGKEQKREFEKEKFFEHYYNILQFDWEGLKKLEEEMNTAPDEETRKTKQKAIAWLKDRIIRAEGYFKSIDLELDRELGYYNEELETAKSQFIEYGKTGSKEKAEKELVIGIINYLNCEIPGLRPIVTELAEVTEFQDFDGNDMPVPLKGKPDMLAMINDEDIIVDYKLVSQFGERNGAYEIQASNYYFLAQRILWRKPKKMLFIETLKKEVNPASWLLKPQLIAMCEEHGITVDKKDTVAILVEKLLAKEVLEIPSAINIIEIDFEEDPGLIQAFIEIYKEILNRSYYFFIEKSLRFLPNPKADFTGGESWSDFKFEIINELDPIAELQEEKAKPKIQFEF